MLTNFTLSEFNISVYNGANTITKVCHPSITFSALLGSVETISLDPSLTASFNMNAVTKHLVKEFNNLFSCNKYIHV